MSEVETSGYESFTVQHISDEETSNGLDQEKKMETSKSSKNKKTIVFKDKIVISPKRTKRKPNLVRQDTFDLEKEVITVSKIHDRKTNKDKDPGRSKSSHGIRAIIDRAESISGLSPQVKEYLSAHMRMMGAENSRLMAENAKLRTDLMITNSDCDKKLKNLSQQLDREKAKSKLMMSKVRNDVGSSGNDDIILVSKKTAEKVAKHRERSASVGSKTKPRESQRGSSSSSRPGSVGSISSLSLTRAGTPIPAGAGDDVRISLMTKKIKVYRNQIKQLQSELEKMNGILTREVGESHVHSVLAGKSRGWEGRDEIIQNLKRTIEVLEEMAGDRNRTRSESVLSNNNNENVPSLGAIKRAGKMAVTEDNPSEAAQMKKLSREFLTLNQAAEVERKRLSELVTLLTTRLKLTEERTTEAEANLREERLKCARAELAAERAQIDLRDSGKLNTSISSRSSSGFRRSLEEDVGKMSVEDLRWEVVRLKEELRAMRRELGESRGAREEMVRIYKQMLDDTRQVYRQNFSDS